VLWTERALIDAVDEPFAHEVSLCRIAAPKLKSRIKASRLRSFPGLLINVDDDRSTNLRILPGRVPPINPMNYAPFARGFSPRQQQATASRVNSKETYMSYDLNAEGINGVKDQTVVVAIPEFPSVFGTPVWNVDGSMVRIEAIWGVTEGGSPAIRGRSSLDGIGVLGEVTSGTGDGVQGHGSGSFSGVAGFGGNVEGGPPGTGVFGLGGTVTGSLFQGGAPGVRGIGGGGPITGPSGPVGVYGQGGPFSAGVRGVGGTGDAVGGPGVVGIAGSVPPPKIPPDSTFANIGVGGFSDISTGVIGSSSKGIGVKGDSGSGNGGYFSSANVAQIHLEPHKGFLLDPNGRTDGRAGDLLVLRSVQQQFEHHEPVATLWFCRSAGLSGWVQLA
jgi:hypothetical protein